MDTKFIGVGMAVLALAAATDALAADAKPKPIFSTGTESSTEGLTLPPPKIVKAIVRSLDKEDVRELNQCVEDQQLRPRAYQNLLRAAVFRPSPNHVLYFVRGADAYCPALYGAHNFQYFLLDESTEAGRTTLKIVFENRGDMFAIYPDVSHSLNDVEATGCIVSECRSARMSFDGRVYRSVICTRRTFDQDHEVTEVRRCGADNWQDDQSSGFAPPPRK